MPIWPCARRAHLFASASSARAVLRRNLATAAACGTARLTMRVRLRMVGRTSSELGAHNSHIVRSAGSSTSLSSTFVVRSSILSTSSIIMMRQGVVEGICSESATSLRTSSIDIVTRSVASTVTSGCSSRMTCLQTAHSPQPCRGHSRAAANARATRERPDPGAPHISHDCAILPLLKVPPALSPAFPLKLSPDPPSDPP